MGQACGIEPCQRNIGTRLIDIGNDVPPPSLFNKAHAFPDEEGRAEGVGFADAPAQRIVGEADGLFALGFCAGAAGGGDGNEVVFFVPGEALARMPANLLFNQATEAVVGEAFVFEDAHEVVAHIAGLRMLGAPGERHLGRWIEQVAGRVVGKGFVADGVY